MVIFLNLQNIAKLIRCYILISTTKAGSGHPTSSLSSVELLTALFCGGFFKFNLDDIENPNNDRFILSKGHSAPLLYSMYAVLGKAESDKCRKRQVVFSDEKHDSVFHQLSALKNNAENQVFGVENSKNNFFEFSTFSVLSEDDLLKLRKFDSPLEGHPTPNFKYAEIASGSLGQGLSVGVGMALNAKYLDKLPYKTFVLLGDSEMSEGSNWEALQIANYYKLNNLVGIIDVNRLGQRGETMYGWDIQEYAKRISTFGWETILIKDGHNFKEIIKAYQRALNSNKPVMLIAKTIKGKGVSFLENKEGWHGKVLNEEELKKALVELGEVDKSVKIELLKPESKEISNFKFSILKQIPEYKIGDMVATRKAYGEALKKLYPKYPNIVALDAETKNSTFSEIFEKEYPSRFFEMFIAEQNMLGVALGLSKRGKIPFISSFAAFLTRAFDQIRMSAYSNANIKIVGSHCGVSIGEDGVSQMGLEDISMFRSVFGSVVLYSSDAVSTEKLVEEAIKHNGIVYIRTTRKDTPVIYNNDENFEIGGFKVVRENEQDSIAIISAGITLHEAIKASDELKSQGVFVKVIDLYSIKPIDAEKLMEAIKNAKAIITVEDHYIEGGIGEVIRSALQNIKIPIHSLAVLKMPHSGTPEQLLEFEEISKTAIIKKAVAILKNNF
ncbi:MAG: transketolase [Patescibacteria group bacterium]